MSISPITDEFDYPDFEPGDDIDSYKHGLEIALRIFRAERSALAQLRAPDGRPLYRVTSTGNLVRTRKVSPRIRRLVRNRDRVCVWCGSDRQLEVDHIVRYADGGPNTPDNLRVLCKPCHDTRRGGDQ